MLLSLLDILVSDPFLFLRLFPIMVGIVGISVLTAITIHEFSHAVVAYLLGDSVAHHQGRVSLNPFHHLDRAGTLMILLIGFGWGKPVQFNPNEIRFGRTGIALVAMAGPISNFFTSAVIAFLVKTNVMSLDSGLGVSLIRVLEDPTNLLVWIVSITTTTFSISILLGIFNLLPIAPLDGFQASLAIAPRPIAIFLQRYNQYGMLLLFGIIGADIIFGTGFLNAIIQPVTEGITNLLIKS
ncbi:MAG: site-2 protease family protein [SAR202 cluster bacterium]|nr:site-2 protease family protein [SAR202 cluster bacterium]